MQSSLNIFGVSSMTAIYTVAAGLFLLVTFPSTAHAYIDPGTGAMLIQGLIGGIVGGLFIIRMYWQKLKSFIFGSTGGDIADQEIQPKEQPRAEDG
jgi:hypothetical protein